MTVAETFSLDEAKTNDRLELLRGGQPSAEEFLRAALSGRDDSPAEPAADVEAEEPADVEVATIVDFAAWVQNMSGGEG